MAPLPHTIRRESLWQHLRADLYSVESHSDLWSERAVSLAKAAVSSCSGATPSRRQEITKVRVVRAGCAVAELAIITGIRRGAERILLGMPRVAGRARTGDEGAQGMTPAARIGIEKQRRAVRAMLIPVSRSEASRKARRASGSQSTAAATAP